MSFQEVKKHVMTGISYMIPMIVAGGVLGAFAKLFGTYDIGSLGPDTSGATVFSYVNLFSWTDFWWTVNMVSSYAMSFACGVLAAGIAYSMSDRPGIVPAFIIGYTANVAKAGFLGALVMGLFIGWLVNVFKKAEVPSTVKALMPVLIIPIFVTFISIVLFFGVICTPMSMAMTFIQDWMMSLNGGSQFIVGAVIGAAMGFDLGGPINKTASMAANALFADGYAAPESAKIVGGMTPPLGAYIATVLAKDKFTKSEKETGVTCIAMGLCFITEGAIPFAAADPARFIPCSMLGSAIAGGMVMALGCSTPAAHGGIFIVPITENPMMFLLALVVGSVVTGVLYAVLKRPLAEGTSEEEIIDLDIDF